MIGRRGKERWAREAVHGPVDARLTGLVFLLLGFGLVMVYSASSVLSMIQFGTSTAFFTGQATKAVLGVLAMLLVARIDYRIWRPLAKPLVWVSIGLLLLLAFPVAPSLTPEVNGARRWVALPGFSFQPLELAKLALVLWLAVTLSRKSEKLDRFSEGVAPLMALPLAMAGLLLFQPDFKGAGLLVLLAWLMLFLGGVKARYLAGMAAVGIPATLAVLVLEPYRLRRLAAWFDRGEDLSGISYQINQSLISLGSGGWFGVGLGSSKQKFAFLPAAHNDFIFSIIGEELGVLGTLFVLAAFLWFGWIGYRIARRAPDAFGFLLASGITTLVLIAALVNIGVATAVLPTTGLTLPFISYGGTSLVIQLVAVGILMSVSRDAVEEPPGRWAARASGAPQRR
ncbi:MAG: putative lipid II flippase FtsW [Gemmatimonadetes bacterium]|nr:putative lipid II flippase FtsW [Gemmatimonadota bacterium]